MRRRGFLKRVGAAGATTAAFLAGNLDGGAAGPARKSQSLWGRLQDRQIAVSARVVSYDGARPVHAVDVGLDGGRTARADIDGTSWTIAARADAVRDRPDAIDMHLQFKLTKGKM
ncbi:MAG TPA: hypothetical protein VFH73_21675 [Polyangia bacterium]|nr:hypothetical protein [Polyangia bacterium]